MNISKARLLIFYLALILFPFNQPSQAASPSEIQVQINALISQVQTLQAQLLLIKGATTSIPSACMGITFNRPLLQGSYGNDVKCLQSLLNQNSDTRISLSGGGSPEKETYYYGYLTKLAVIKFQNKYSAELLMPIGLTKGTGIVGPLTRTKLNSITSALITTPSVQLIIPLKTGTTTIITPIQTPTTGSGGGSGFTTIMPNPSSSTTLNLIQDDNIAPSQITSLSISNKAQTSITLTWIAPGDDGLSGTATSYDIRYSTASTTISNWTSATQVSVEPTPLISGTAQTCVVAELTASTTYYFAITATDDAGNLSVISNIASGNTLTATSDCYGAESCNLTGNPIGGGAGYSDIISQTDPRVKFVVSDKDQFLSALSNVKPGEAIYIPENVSIDLTGVYSLPIPEGTIIASNRGSGGSAGGRIFQNRTGNDPHGDAWNTLTASTIWVHGNNVRITGLRIEGPDKIDADYFFVGIRSAILLSGDYKGLVVDNNEIFGWSYAGVAVLSFYVTNQAEGLATAEIGSSIANIHHNYFHNIWGADYGYAVGVGGYEALIKANLFENTRHSIAASGYQNEGYEASYNIQIGTSTASTFDVHGHPSDGDMAGTLYRIHHNTILSNYNHAIGIRGAPEINANISYNILRDCAINCYAESYNAVVQFGYNYNSTNITMVNNIIDGVYRQSGPVGKVY